MNGLSPSQILVQIQNRWRTIVVFVPYVWLLVFFLAPFFIVMKIGLSETTIASPPYKPMVEWLEMGFCTPEKETWLIVVV